MRLRMSYLTDLVDFERGTRMIDILGHNVYGVGADGAIVLYEQMDDHNKYGLVHKTQLALLFADFPSYSF